MVDPFSIAASGVGVIKAALEAVDFIRGLNDANVISASFDWSGVRSEGSEEIEIEQHQAVNDQSVWWFSVKEREGYTFIRFPVVESGIYELVGQVQGNINPDARYWRWVAEPQRGVLYGASSPVNVK